MVMGLLIFMVMGLLIYGYGTPHLLNFWKRKSLNRLHIWQSLFTKSTIPMENIDLSHQDFFIDVLVFAHSFDGIFSKILLGERRNFFINYLAYHSIANNEKINGYQN